MTAVDLTNPIFTDLEAARKHFEAIRWPNGPYCPHCGQYDLWSLGVRDHCKDCRALSGPFTNGRTSR